LFVTFTFIEKLEQTFHKQQTLFFSLSWICCRSDVVAGWL